jgi:hypothetical protein
MGMKGHLKVVKLKITPLKKYICQNLLRLWLHQDLEGMFLSVTVSIPLRGCCTTEAGMALAEGGGRRCPAHGQEDGRHRAAEAEDEAAHGSRSAAAR